ncbi:MAG: outer membrane beta-barrel protein [Cyclobacteriaceae bacterium]
MNYRVPLPNLLGALSFFAASLLMTPLSAQDDSSGDDSGNFGSASTIKLGLKTGVNFNSFIQPGMTVGPNFGATARFSLPFTDIFDAQVELFYNSQGGGREDLSRTVEGAISQLTYINRAVVFHNLELPVILNFGLPELNGERMEPRFLIGLSYGYMMGAFEISDQVFTPTDPDLAAVGGGVTVNAQNVRATADYERHQFGFLTGIALDNKLDNGKTFTTELRYRVGLNNVNNFPFTGELYTQTVSLSFAYTIFSIL